MDIIQFIIYMFVIALSPLIAIQVSVSLSKRQEKRQRRNNAFRILMSTRSAPLLGEHVQALNMVPLEFSGKDKKSRDVITAWRAYVSHLNKKDIPLQIWEEKTKDLFINLLQNMARSLNYEFDKTEIQDTSYFPIAYHQQEMTQSIIQNGLAEILEGKRSLPVRIQSEKVEK